MMIARLIPHSIEISFFNYNIVFSLLYMLDTFSNISFNESVRHNSKAGFQSLTTILYVDIRYDLIAN